MQSTLFCLSVTLSALFAEGSDVEAQPNVIVVMADDISTREFKVYGSDSCTDEWAATLSWKGSIVRQRGVYVPFVVYAPGKKDPVQGEQNVISDLFDLLPTLANIIGSGSVSATKDGADN